MPSEYMSTFADIDFASAFLSDRHSGAIYNLVPAGLLIVSDTDPDRLLIHLSVTLFLRVKIEVRFCKF